MKEDLGRRRRPKIKKLGSQCLGVAALCSECQFLPECSLSSPAECVLFSCPPGVDVPHGKPQGASKTQSRTQFLIMLLSCIDIEPMVWKDFYIFLIWCMIQVLWGCKACQNHTHQPGGAQWDLVSVIKFTPVAEANMEVIFLAVILWF